MNKLWLKDKKKVFLSSFTNSEMKKEADDRYTYVKDFWRKKTYVKDEDMLLPGYKREFPEPYQVAQFSCGGTWNDYNAPLAIQVGLCNLDCRWCFVDDKLKKCEIGAYFSAKDIINLWKNVEDRGILRVTGGEAFLAPEFLIEIGKELKQLNSKSRFLWIDTNLLGRDYDIVVKKLTEFNIPYGICGCFKGFDEETFEFNTQREGNLLQKQFENTKKILNSLGDKGELFFYVPEIIEVLSETIIREKIKKFIVKIQNEIHKVAPLRISVLEIHEYYANMEKMIKDRLESGLTKSIWFSILKEIYPGNLLWLPQYQINIKD